MSWALKRPCLDGLYSLLGMDSQAGMSDVGIVEVCAVAAVAGGRGADVVGAWVGWHEQCGGGW